MSWLTDLWTHGEDGRQADGWRGDAFGGNFVSEQFYVRNLPTVYSIWSRPSLIARLYEDGRITLAEKEWRPGR